MTGKCLEELPSPQRRAKRSLCRPPSDQVCPQPPWPLLQLSKTAGRAALLLHNRLQARKSRIVWISLRELVLTSYPDSRAVRPPRIQRHRELKERESALAVRTGEGDQHGRAHCVTASTPEAASQPSLGTFGEPNYILWFGAPCSLLQGPLKDCERHNGTFADARRHVLQHRTINTHCGFTQPRVSARSCRRLKRSQSTPNERLGPHREGTHEFCSRPLRCSNALLLRASVASHLRLAYLQSINMVATTSAKRGVHKLAPSVFVVDTPFAWRQCGSPVDVSGGTCDWNTCTAGFWSATVEPRQDKAQNGSPAILDCVCFATSRCAGLQVHISPLLEVVTRYWVRAWNERLPQALAAAAGASAKLSRPYHL